MCLFICALWSPAGKGLTSWLSFVVSNCELVTFPLISWVSRLAPVLKTVFHQWVISYTCSQSYSDGSVLRTGSTRTIPTNFLVGN